MALLPLLRTIAYLLLNLVQVLTLVRSSAYSVQRARSW